MITFSLHTEPAHLVKHSSDLKRFTRSPALSLPAISWCISLVWRIFFSLSVQLVLPPKRWSYRCPRGVLCARSLFWKLFELAETVLAGKNGGPCLNWLFGKVDSLPMPYTASVLLCVFLVSRGRQIKREGFVAGHNEGPPFRILLCTWCSPFGPGPNPPPQAAFFVWVARWSVWNKGKGDTGVTWQGKPLNWFSISVSYDLYASF